MEAHTEELLNLYIDGELPIDQQGALFSHLAESRSARVQFDALMAFRLASRVDMNPVAPAVDEALFQRIDQLRAGQQLVDRAEDRRPFRALRRRVTIGTTLALMALVLVIRALLPGAAPTETVRIVPVEHVEPVYVMWPGVTVEDETLVGQ